MRHMKILEGIVGGLLGIFCIWIVGTVILQIINDDSAPVSKMTPVAQQPVEPVNIVVTSQAIKYIDGKYRYFFNIKNNDSKSFAGDVTIDIINAEGNSIYDKTFTASKPIASGLGSSVYFDVNTGPTSIHGTNGILTYSSVVKVEGNIVAESSGNISSIVE